MNTQTMEAVIATYARFLNKHEVECEIERVSQIAGKFSRYEAMKGNDDFARDARMALRRLLNGDTR